MYITESKRFIEHKLPAKKCAVILAGVLAIAAFFLYASSAMGIDWNNLFGSYADSNPVTIPAVPAGPTQAKGWQFYD